MFDDFLKINFRKKRSPRTETLERWRCSFPGVVGTRDCKVEAPCIGFPINTGSPDRIQHFGCLAVWSRQEEGVCAITLLESVLKCAWSSLSCWRPSLWPELAYSGNKSLDSSQSALSAPVLQNGGHCFRLDGPFAGSQANPIWNPWARRNCRFS